MVGKNLEPAEVCAITSAPPPTSPPQTRSNIVETKGGPSLRVSTVVKWQNIRDMPFFASYKTLVEVLPAASPAGLSFKYGLPQVQEFF